MPSKRARSLILATPTELPTEIPSFKVNHRSCDMSDEQTQRQNDDDFVYDSDLDPETNNNALRIPIQQTSSSSSMGITAPIVSANQETERRAPVALDNAVEQMAPVVLGNVVTNATASLGLPNAVTSATNIMAPIASANQVTNTAASLRAAADIMDPAILQIGNVVLEEQTRTITDLTHQTVFNMRTAVSLTDTVNETFAAKFLKGRWESHIQPHALFLIRLRLHDTTYRALSCKNGPFGSRIRVANYLWQR